LPSGWGPVEAGSIPERHGSGFRLSRRGFYRNATTASRKKFSCSQADWRVERGKRAASPREPGPGTGKRRPESLKRFRGRSHKNRRLDVVFGIVVLGPVEEASNPVEETSSLPATAQCARKMRPSCLRRPRSRQRRVDREAPEPAQSVKLGVLKAGKESRHVSAPPGRLRPLRPRARPKGGGVAAR
jgi:hypothetical protein